MNFLTKQKSLVYWTVESEDGHNFPVFVMYLHGTEYHLLESLVVGVATCKMKERSWLTLFESRIDCGVILLV